MVDIWGRSSSKEQSKGDDTTDDVKKLIKGEIASTLNLASVDPAEIVVFGEKQGKLKTNNVSLDDILVKQIGAADNTIALFHEGKLKPGVLMPTIIDTHKTLRDEYNDHIVKFNQL